MASVEAIALESYPIWDKQPDEPAEIFGLFERYFLPRIKANLTAAYRDFVADAGGDSQAVTDASGQWREYCKAYQWRERHQAYWLKKTWDDREWRDQKIKENQATALDTVALLRSKAQEILENLVIEETTAKDAAALLRLANEMADSALGYGDLDKAINKVFAAGFEVIDPKSEHLNGHVADSG